MSELDSKHPAFTIGIRGYDRQQVDEYIEHLQERVEEAEERAHNAETEYVFDEHAAVGPRIAEIFALAEAEARELRERVATQATQLVSEARTEAEAIIAAAEQSAREVNERTRRDHAEMIAELENERERIRDEVVELEERRADAIAELNHLRDVLGEAAGTVGGTRTAGRRTLPAGGGETVELPAITAEAEEY